MFDLLLTYISELVDFGSIDLVSTFGKYLDTLSSTPPII